MIEDILKKYGHLGVGPPAIWSASPAGSAAVASAQAPVSFGRAGMGSLSSFYRVLSDAKGNSWGQPTPRASVLSSSDAAHNRSDPREEDEST